jgi:2-amino-4-hydroxy-6-hydroxymethyldihydropteridine diphosphokinase
MKIVQAYVGIGSNIDKVKNIDGCLSHLRELFGEIKISPIYQSKAIGLDGDDFYNLVVRFETSFDIDILETKLREIEYYFGRKRNQPPHTSRTLDIDLLLFGNLVSKEHNIPRNDIIKYGFVLKPLCDIEPDLIHPTTGEKIIILWEKFDLPDQSMQILEGNILENI